MSNEVKQFGHINSGKSLSLILIIILLFNVFGYNIFFNQLQKSIRHDIAEQIRSGIKDSELSMIEVTPQVAKQMTWIKPHKEFSYQGCLYDVVRISENDGRKVLHCINDTKEIRLIKAYAKNEASTQKTRKLLNTINFTYIFEEEANHFIVETSSHEYYTQPFHLNSKSKEISDPPPKPSLHS